MSESEKIAAAAALADKQLKAAWAIAKDISRASDGNLNFLSQLGVAAIMQAICTNMATQSDREASHA